MEIRVFDDMEEITLEEIQRLLPLVSEERREEALRYKHLFGQFACLKSYVMLREMLETRDARLQDKDSPTLSASDITSTANLF